MKSNYIHDILIIVTENFENYKLLKYKNGDTLMGCSYCTQYDMNMYTYIYIGYVTILLL